MKELGKRFEVYMTRLFFGNEEKDFIDFIIMLTFPVWGFFFGIVYLIIQLVSNIFGGFKNGKE